MITIQCVYLSMQGDQLAMRSTFDGAARLRKLLILLLFFSASSRVKSSISRCFFFFFCNRSAGGPSDRGERKLNEKGTGLRLYY